MSKEKQWTFQSSANRSDYIWTLPERPCSRCGKGIAALPQYEGLDQFCSALCHVGYDPKTLEELEVFKALLAAGEEPSW